MERAKLLMQFGNQLRGLNERRIRNVYNLMWPNRYAASDAAMRFLLDRPKENARERAVGMHEAFQAAYKGVGGAFGLLYGGLRDPGKPETNTGRGRSSPVYQSDAPPFGKPITVAVMSQGQHPATVEAMRKHLEATGAHVVIISSMGADDLVRKVKEQELRNDFNFASHELRVYGDFVAAGRRAMNGGKPSWAISMLSSGLGYEPRPLSVFNKRVRNKPGPPQKESQVVNGNKYTKKKARRVR